MLAGIPAPKEVCGNLVLSDNDGECWVLTDDSGLIANAGAAAVIGSNKADVIDMLNTRADVPAGFTHYKSVCMTHWFDDTDTKVKSSPLFQFYNRIYSDNAGKSNREARNKTASLIVKTTALVASSDATAIDLLSQARVTPEGVHINKKQLRELFKPNHDAGNVNEAAMVYGNKWTSGGPVRDTTVWDIKGPVILDDKYLVRPVNDCAYVLVYNPTRVAALRTRRKNNKGTKRQPRQTAFQSLCSIVHAFEREAWQWSQLEWYLATANYKTRGLDHCGRTIIAFTKFATQIGRMSACRKAYKKDLQAAWYHRKLLTTNTSEEFMRWYWRELKLAGKPEGAVEFERQEREKQAKKARRAAEAQKYLAKVSAFKGQTKGDQNVK